MVSRHVASEVAAVSVGENACPLPLLSTGASVTTLTPDDRWVASVLNSFKYTTFEVAMIVCKIKELVSKKVLCILLSASFYGLMAQQMYDDDYAESALKGGVHASPNGWGLVYRSARPIQYNGYSRVLDFSLTSVKHYKEKTILNQRIVNTSPYTYGKVNRLYAFRPMFGVQKMLAEKVSKNSVGINAFAAGGPTVGFLKPVFVNVEIPDPNNPSAFIAVARRYKPDEIPPSIIIGNSAFTKGVNQTRIIGGLSFKSGVEFNWGTYSSDFKSLEVGFMVDWFPSRPELMYPIKNKTVYSAFYLSFAYGKSY